VLKLWLARLKGEETERDGKRRTPVRESTHVAVSCHGRASDVL
jgi:hypothetical protein